MLGGSRWIPQVRPEFRGDEMLDEITGDLRKDYPAHLRRQKQEIGGVVLLCAVICVVIVFIAITEYKLLFAPDDTTMGMVHKFIAGLLQGVSIYILNQLYERTADWLTWWENHRFDSQYDSALAVKIFAFQFFNW